jgi:hypothetical protein
MSSSFFIPLRYVLHYDGDVLILNEHIQSRVEVDHYRNSSGNIVVGQFVMQSIYMVELPDRKLQIYPSRDGTTEDAPFKGFHFSGFFDSCQEIIKLLGMPLDTPIS